MWLGFDSRTRCHMWVEFVVGSRPCAERFFSRYSGFPISSKTNISKFQFNLDYCQVLYHEPLAREIAKVVPMLLILDKLFYFTLLFRAWHFLLYNSNTTSHVNIIFSLESVPN